MKHQDVPGVRWRKSSYSGAASNCVEVADVHPGAVAVRDSKDPLGARLVFSAAEWRSFAAGVKAGRSEVG